MYLLKLLTVLLLGLFSMTAGAGHDTYPQHSGPSDYADIAVRQARASLRQGCGYHGARWTENYGHHLRWAQRKSWPDRQREIDLRARYLRECGSRYAHNRYRDHDYRGDRRHDGYRGAREHVRRSGFARWYADTAVAQVRESRQFGCHRGPSRGLWSPSWQAHYRWALRASRHEAMREIRRRDRRLERCSTYAWRGY